ncbi:zinc finger MYND domain-containing protein 12 [Antennarius striatus]|uniref:zinc finger MYND domain-containing protein 12 n=1 Tax=Antennarius striatus TaxID=241820 RepID=UPI0035B46493
MAAEPFVLGSRAKTTPSGLQGGTEKLCELCGARAHLQCPKCRVTFYCNAEHQQADWVGIHERICELLVPIRSPTNSSLQRAGRIEMQLKKAELIDICRLVAQDKLSEGKYQESLPAAEFCLRSSLDVHGSSCVQIVPAYLLLAEANIGLRNLSMAAELLSQAEWAAFKSPECGPAVRHRLHRSLGRLHVATGNLEAALFNFANDIYFSSEEYDVDSTVTCGGYFLMAEVFVQQGKMPIAHSLYSEVARIWHCHLTELVKTHNQYARDSNVLAESSIDRAQRADVDKMLRTVLEFEQNDFRKDSTQTALVAHCLAMLWFLGEDSFKARGFCNMALQASQLIPNHDLTKPICGLLQLLQGLPTEPLCF